MKTETGTEPDPGELVELADAIAPGWERQREFVEETMSPVRDWMLDRLGSRPDETVLELAAGAGDLGFSVASEPGESGRLISTDFSPEMLEVCRRRGAERGVKNVEYREIDAVRNDLETDSVDAVICRLGYMLMADPAAALAQTRRVLRPDGRLVLSVWGSPERNPFFAFMAVALVERGHMPVPDPAEPGVFSMGSPEKLQSLLGGAGFESIRVEEVGVTFAFSDLEHVLRMATDTAGPIAMVLRALTEGERREVKSGLEKSLSFFATEAGYELPGATLCALAGSSDR